ncbi:TPA: hypothetical protein VB895_001905 [Streptococcus suis]|nr:hypothetical protein [Streptococcus suis]HEP1829099.1 hypothetical protein [Streptococcus suis]
MKFIYLGLILYAILYIYQIINGLRKIQMTHELIDTFNKAFESKDISEWRHQLVPLMPKLKYLNPSYPIDALSYDKDDYYFHVSVKTIYSQLFTIQDYLLFDKWKIFNPLTPLKDVFLIPSKILRFLGLDLNSIVSAIISTITWMVIYHDKISTLITSLKPIFEEFFKSN